MSTQSDSYDAQMAAWKAKHGVTSGVADEVDHEALMVAEDAKRKGKDYCIQCAEQFSICDMRLITRSDDPYAQFDDEEEPADGREWYIKVKLRVRMCRPCFAEEHPPEDSESENNSGQTRPAK